MAIKALLGIVPEWYTPIDEKDEPNPAQFKLRPLTTPEFEEVSTISEKGGLYLDLKDYNTVLQMGVVDWRNYNDPENGGPMKTVRTSLERLPLSTRMELAVEIYNRSQMREEDEKN